MLKDEKETMSSRYPVGQITFPMKETLSRKQRSFLDIAVRMAESSEVSFRHGAVIVRGGSVLSVGVNKWKNVFPLDIPCPEYNPNISIHAEVDALSRCADPRGATIYIARVNKSGKERMSRPCIDCEKALIKAGIKKVIYTL